MMRVGVALRGLTQRALVLLAEVIIATSSSSQALMKSCSGVTVALRCPPRPCSCTPAPASSPYPREETLDVELDVGLKERQPHVAERLVDDILGELAHPGELLPRLAKPVGERLEHGFPLRLGVAA
jgi:hypothetical protein